MRLFGWTADEGGLAHIRVRVPFNELAKHGHTTHLSTIFEREHGDADTLVGCRIALPDPSRLWTHACGMLGGPFCVFETDDDNLGIAKWNRLRPAANVASPLEFWARPEVRFYYMANMRVAHRIITSTPYLQGLLSEQTGHPDIVVAPNAVPEWMRKLPRRDPFVTQDRMSEADPLIVGWAGGASHMGDWEWCKNGIRRVITKLPQTKLRFVGQDFRYLLNLPPERLEHIPWFKNVDDYWRLGLNDIDIGLAPLRPEPFNRAKSEIRLIEYAARGIPTIASDYGPYSDFIDDDFDGILVKKPGDWQDAIDFLVKDPQARLRMGTNAWAKSREHTIEHLWPRYEEAYTP